MTPAVSYMRCSGLSQVEGDTWDRQTETIASCANLKQMQLIQEYRDQAIPGQTEEDCRPAFQQMIADLLGNGCRIIIIESMDRLAREYRVQEQLIIYIASKGITLIAANTGENITEAMMGDPMRRALVQIQGIFAELDKNMLVAKLRKARVRQKSKNGRCEGRKPFGTDIKERVTLQMIRDLAHNGRDSRTI